MASIVVTIDGPAGSGKTTTAGAVARRLGLPHVESGALYRALTLAGLDQGTRFAGQQLVALARSLPVRFALTEAGFRTEVAAADVSEAVRSERVTARVSELSAIPEVREWANGEVRRAVAEHPRGAVLDGRDMGTVVFPDAGVKVYLTATAEERARRRLLQEGRTVDERGVAEEAQLLTARDRADQSRVVAPLMPAEDAVVLDTTGMSFEEQVATIVELVRNAFS